MDKLTNNSSKMNLNINTKIFENKSISDEDKFMIKISRCIFQMIYL